MKKFYGCLIALLLFAAVLFFLWPRSLGAVDMEIQSVRIQIIEREQERVTVEFPENCREIQEILQVLDQYSYHYSVRTIPGFFENGTSLKGNDAGFWVYIDLYSKPNYQGDSIGIISGGTKELAFDNAVWRIGYWRNHKNLELMNEFYERYAANGRDGVE